MVYAMTADPRISQINRLLERSNKSVRWLARQVGSVDTTVGKILSGETKNPRDPEIVDRMLQVFEQVPTVPVIGIEPRGMRRVPVYTSIMAGDPTDGYYDGNVEWESIPDWGGEFERWGRTISGDSMHPVFEPGDIAIFENRRYETGSVVHAFNDGEDCIKAVREVDGKLMLCSFNPDGPQIPADGWKIKGVCVTRIRKGRFGIRHMTDFPGGLSWAMKDAVD